MRRPFLTLRALGTGLLLVLATLFVLPSTPAQAGTTLLCKGFTDCFQKGYVNYGYASHYREMHWRMYAGHNCTNYAAYRVIQMGGPKERPWSGSGNASNWGVELAHLTDRTPTVGSVAWWRSRNHVQIVEKVIDANTIVVSEDHWGGDFNWAIVRRSSGHWPDGFIHIVKETLAPSAAPSIPSQARVGQAVTAKAGTWPAGSRLEYQWLAGGWPIAGATSLTYVPRPEDAGKWLIFRVIASHPDYQKGKAYSQKSAPVSLGVLKSDGAPTVTGQPKVTGTLQGTPPTITPAPSGLARQWFADGVAIDGATGPSLTLGEALLGKRITFAVTATRPGYTPLRTQSAPTEPVGPETLEVAEPARIAAVPRFGQTYTLDPGRIATPGASVAVAWYRDGQPITSAAGARSYTLQPADLGRSVSAKVMWRKPGYDPVVYDFDPGVVLTVPEISALRVELNTVEVRVNAPGVPTVAGVVRVLGPDGLRRTAVLRGGRATFAADDWPRGRQAYRIRYFAELPVADRTVGRWVHLAYPR